MKQQNSTGKRRNKPNEYPEEMEQYISLLEEENALQKQIIANLEKENDMIQKHFEKYKNLVDQMMKDLP